MSGGMVEDAVARGRRAVERAPENAVAHAELGLLLQEQGRLHEAEACYRRALALQPGFVPVLVNLGLIRHALGQLDEAVHSFEAALQHAPGLPEAHFSLGNAERDRGRPDVAERCFRRALELRPDYAEARNNLGLLFGLHGRLEEAIEFFEQLLAAAPDHAEAHNNLGMIWYRRHRPEPAEACYRRALALEPGLAQAWNNLANLLSDRGALDEAVACYRQALELDPAMAQAHHNLGNVLLDQGRREEALAAFREALRLRPRSTATQIALGTALERLGRLGEARAAYDQALALEPGSLDALVARANLLVSQCRFREAIADYRRAIAGGSDLAQSDLLFCLNFDPEQSDADLAAAHRAWSERHPRPPPAQRPREPGDPDRTLRIGLVGADFGRHPVGFFLLPLLENSDPDRVEFVCYSGRSREDELSDRLRARAAGWHRTGRLGDAELADAIRADRIDILIDLAGHTAGNRLGCFALRPAPLLVQWAGYCHSVPTVDASIWDWVQVPGGEERWFAEEVVRLPDVRWCYGPPAWAPEVAPPPWLERGFITFGSFNNLCKVNPEVVALWARVLAAVPGARLLLSWPTLAGPDQPARLAAEFARHGVHADRLDLRPGPGTHAGVLGEYAEVDIALDPFPFTGCLSTCEALWMGVPLVTLPRSRPVSRQSQAFLTALGRPEWVARDPDDYVRIATELAADPDRLAMLRRDQRARMAASPVCDGPRFARNFETALRGIWRAWSEDGEVQRPIA